MNGIIGVVPDDVPIEMYLEQHDDNDTLIPIAQHPRLRVHWVARHDEKSLAAAIESRDWSDWYAWATPEATTLKQVRDAAARRIRLSQIGGSRPGLLERRARDGHPPR